jgi:hypothetical protein
LHLQLANVPLAPGEFEFDGHDVHAEVEEEYVPAPQFVQVDSAVAPVAVEIFPAPQGVHAAAPAETL